jgi:hypothetical protein
MEHIDPDKVESRDTEDIDEHRLMEIGMSEPWSKDKEYHCNSDTRESLHDECDFQEILGFRILPVDDILRQEVIETLGTTEIIQSSEERHKTDHPIDHPDATDREIMRYDDLDEVSERSDQERE